MNKKLALSLGLLCTIGTLRAECDETTRNFDIEQCLSLNNTDIEIEDGDERMWYDDEDCCISSLKLNKLCAKKFKSKKATIAKLCAKRAGIKHLQTEKHKTNELCAKHIRAEHVHANKIDTRDLCLDNVHANVGTFPELCTNHISSNGICVNGNVEHCTQYKAWMAMDVDTPYSLGNDINFDTIVDDPNSNVALGPTRYIAPKTGYYIVTLGVGLKALIQNGGSGVIAGIPVSRPEVVVNSLRTLKAFEAFLNFGSPFQNNTLTGLIHLNAGDDVRARYRIFYLDASTGVQPYGGNVILEGVGDQGQHFSETYFMIHYLSSDCPVECPPCPQIECDIQNVECLLIEIDCCEKPCHPCNPCHNHGHNHHEDHDEDGM